MKSEYHVRREKLKKLQNLGIVAYPDHFKKTHCAEDILKLKIGTREIAAAGRIVGRRVLGKISFCHILDTSGRIQAVFSSDSVGEKDYKIFTELIDVGDLIGVRGEVFKTKKGEQSLLAKNYVFLGKAIRPLPEKWHGLKEQELCYRQRYLDLIANTETKKRFELRSLFIRALREFYWNRGFTEIETPILATTASGALARPFATHHDALDILLYLRISAGELWQKTAIIGGFEKTFEIGKVFRNEGIDPSHLQEFTMVEHYAAYWNYEDNMKFTEEMIPALLKKVFGKMKFQIKNKNGASSDIDFSPPWKRISFQELLLRDSGIDISRFPSAQELISAIKKENLFTQDMKNLGLGNLIDTLYKKVSREKIIEPTFITGHPIEVSPLARKNDAVQSVVDRFQLVVNGWEIVNAYSELVDPEDQKKRFSEQANAKKSGDEEAHGEDDEYILALEHGSPPISGWGMGIDRILALLTQQENLKDVVLFPTLRSNR